MGSFEEFHSEDCGALSRLLQLQLLRHDPWHVAALLLWSRCMMGARVFLPCDALGVTLRKLFSRLSQEHRNGAVHAVLAECSTEEFGGWKGYHAHTAIGEGAVYIMRQLFESGASPLLRDGSGVQLFANVLCNRIRGEVEEGDTDLGLSPIIISQLDDLIDDYTPKKWTVESHHLFPDDFRARVLELLLCNQRFQSTGAVHLSLDALEQVIQWLAVGEVLGEDAIENEFAKIEGEEQEDSSSYNSDDGGDDRGYRINYAYHSDDDDEDGFY
jgi:hypothetical protein